jgi:hypothetical protein
MATQVSMQSSPLTSAPVNFHVDDNVKNELYYRCMAARQNLAEQITAPRQTVLEIKQRREDAEKMVTSLRQLEIDEHNKVAFATRAISCKINILDVLMNLVTSTGGTYFAVETFWMDLFACLRDIFSDTGKEQVMDIPEICGMAVLLRDSFVCKPCIVKMTYDHSSKWGTKWNDEPTQIKVNDQAVGKDCFVHSLLMNPEGTDGAIVRDCYVLTFAGLAFTKK